MTTKEESESFANKVEALVKDKNMTYIEAVLHLEPEDVELSAKLMSPALTLKIQREAENLNYLKKTNKSRLPL